MPIKFYIVAVFFLFANDGFCQFISIPLKYFEKTATYNVLIRINENKAQPFILDTGSGMMVVAPEDSFCPHCSFINNERYYRPDLKTASPIRKKSSEISYLGESGFISKQSDNIIVANKIHLTKYAYGMWVAGKNLVSILGVDYQDKRRDKVLNSSSFIQKIVKRYNLQPEFSIVQCGQNGKSYFYVGGLPADIEKIPAIKISTLTNSFQTDAINGFIGQKSELILPHEKEKMLIDTGTTANIYLSAQNHERLVSYIKKKTPQNTIEKVLNYNKKFFLGGGCYPRGLVNFTVFPDIFISFKTDTKSQRIKLSPSDYITPLGCDAGLVQFAFMKKKNEQMPSIFGGPFIRKFVVTFSLFPINTIQLRKIDKVCAP